MAAGLDGRGDDFGGWRIGMGHRVAQVALSRTRRKLPAITFLSCDINSR
jgi:hypothetical protein